MAITLTHIPRVLVIQETSVQPGRDKLKGIFNYAHLYGPWHLHLVHGRSGEQMPTAAEWAKCDGIIAGQMMLDLMNALKRAHTPTVLIDPLDEALKPGSPLSKLSRTLDDSANVGRSGADYFLERGYRNFAYVGESLNRNWSERRGESFRQRVAEAGFGCRLYPLSAEASQPDRSGNDESRLGAWLQALPKPVAVLAAMDSRAREVIDVCAEAGLRVPQDVAVLGVDDDELLCNGSTPTLSSIRRDTVACGFMAAQMLDRLMRQETRRRETFLYGVKQIVTRESTRPDLLASDPVVQRAREFIRINAGAGIGVPDIVRHLNVSRRLAETRFRAACGHSLLDEIQSVRLDRVERLLRETDLPLTEVCTRCGYSTDVHLRRIFKRRFGCSMRDFRASSNSSREPVCRPV
jgi:LacI family transcriptional regulator